MEALQFQFGPWDMGPPPVLDQSIHRAVERGDLREVQRMITEDPSLLALKDQYNYTPLLSAASSGHAAILEWLLDYAGANIEEDGGYAGLELTPLFVSCAEGHPEVLSILIKRGANINHRSSPLTQVAYQGRVGILKILLSQKDIDLNVQDESGRTSLWKASLPRHEEVLSLLLAAGADPTIAGNDGETPLDKARMTGHVGCVQLLEAAVAAPERARLLHLIRPINDAHHAIDKAATETEGMNEEERRRKMIAAAPAYLKGRVERIEELPQVEMGRSRRRKNSEEEKVAAVADRMLIGGQVATEVFVELMNMMIPKWDDERRRV